MKSSELLAPVGSYEALQSAIKAGCDAVYFGVTHLNMRAGAVKGFDFEDLKKIADICHHGYDPQSKLWVPEGAVTPSDSVPTSRDGISNPRFTSLARKQKQASVSLAPFENKAKIRAYLTVNTIIYDTEMPLMKKLVDAAKKNKIDAIIASDVSVLRYCHEIGQEVHCSTQLSISNIEAIKFFSQFSDRVVLARELDLHQIKEISNNICVQQIKGPKGNLIEIEAFVHGAMCISVSGRCFMSGFENGLSANRGMCRQMCRRAYKVTDAETGSEFKVEDQYVMSPQDLCAIDFLDKVLDAGVQVLKIEGRGRSPEYVFTVVSAYRKALDAIKAKKYTPKLIEELFEELKSVYNRGLSKGFYFGRPIGAWSKSYGSRATTRKIHVGKVTHFFPRANIAEVQVQSGVLRKSDELYIIGPTTGTVRVTISELRNEKEKKVLQCAQGGIATFSVPDRVRLHDDVFVIEQVSENAEENKKNVRLKERIQG